MGFQEVYLRLCRKIKIKAKASEELSYYVDVLEWDIEPESIAGFARLIFFLSFLLFSPLLMYPSPTSLLLWVLSPFALAQLVGDYPKILGRRKLMRAMDAAPFNLALLCSSLKENPNLERAVEFVSEFGEGEIAEDMKRLLVKVLSGKEVDARRGLEELGKKWGRYFPWFREAIRDILMSLDEKDKERKRMLDNALSRLQRGIRISYQEFIQEMRIPTMLIFSVGAVLPLIIISMLPIISIFSQVSPFLLIFLSLATSLGMVLYSNYVSLKRPPLMFSEPEFGEERPFLLCLSISLFFLTPFLLYSLRLFGIYISISEKLVPISLVLGTGSFPVSYFFFSYANFRRRRRKVRELEEGAISFMEKLVVRLREGRSQEEVISEARGKGEFGKLLRELKGRMKVFGLKEALDVDVDSKLVKVLFHALKRSQEQSIKLASESVGFLLEQLRDLRLMRRQMEVELKKYVDMLLYTSMFILPVIAGVGVRTQGAIMERIRDIPLFQVTPLDMLTLKCIVGLYVVTSSLAMLYHAKTISGRKEIWANSHRYILPPLVICSLSFL